MTDFIFFSKITEDGDCSHKIERQLLFGMNAMTNWQHIKKQRQHFADKEPHSQSYGFLSSHVWVWDRDCKTLKNWCFQTVVLEKILRVPWTARRSNQSILKEINPEYSSEELILKLKLQYFGLWCEELTHWKRLWCWDRLRAGGEGGDRGWDGWMISLIQCTWVCANCGR